MPTPKTCGDVLAKLRALQEQTEALEAEIRETERAGEALALRKTRNRTRINQLKAETAAAAQAAIRLGCLSHTD